MVEKCVATDAYRMMWTPKGLGVYPQEQFSVITYTNMPFRLLWVSPWIENFDNGSNSQHSKYRRSCRFSEIGGFFIMLRIIFVEKVLELHASPVCLDVGFFVMRHANKVLKATTYDLS